MKTLPLAFALLISLPAAALPASAAAPSASAPSASAPAVIPAVSAPSAKPEKHPPTAEERHDSGAKPDLVRPDSRITPQLNVPLTPSGAGKATYVPPARGKPAQSGGVDDSAARCNAMTDAAARKECLDKLR